MQIVTAYHDSFLALTKSIHELDKQLAQREKNESSAARLEMMPRIGRIAALTFLAAVDNLNRFPSSRKLVGYSGLAPTVRQSSTAGHTRLIIEQREDIDPLGERRLS